MMENNYTELDSKLIQGLTTDEVDEIFITRMLLGYEEFHDFNPMYMVGNFLHYPGLNTWEKVYDKTYSIIQKIMEQGYVTYTAYSKPVTTFEQLDKHKDKIYSTMDGTCDNAEEYDFLFKVSDKGHQYVEHNYPKHQTIIDEIMHLEEDSLNNPE